MKKGLILCSLLISSFAYSQKVLQEKILSPSGKSLGLISVLGLRSVVSGAGPINNAGLTPALDFIDLQGEGFLTRKEFKFTMYNDNFESLWEAEASKVFGLQKLPSSFTVGNKNAIYFVQLGDGTNNIHITRFDAHGKSIEKLFTFKDKFSGESGGFLSEDSNLNYIFYNFSKKEKRYTYSIITFNASDLSITEKKLGLETSAFEIEKACTGSKIYHRPYNFCWQTISRYDNKSILIKQYIKDLENPEKQEFIIKTVELSSDGTLSNTKDFTFTPPNTSKYPKYHQPIVKIDTLRHEVYVCGVIMLKNSFNVDGIYVNKFDYLTGAVLYKKEIPFTLINQKIPEKSQLKDIRYNFEDYFPIFNFNSASCYLDIPNQGLRLLLYKDSKGSFQSKLQLLGIRLNKNGDLEWVEDFDYKNNIMTFYAFKLIPEKHTVYWKADNPDYQLGPLDYINGLGTTMDPDYVLCSVFRKKDYNLVIYVREKDSEIKIVKLEKETFK